VTVGGFSVDRFACCENLLTYGESHWSFPGVTVFAVIEPRPVPWGGDGDPLDFVFDFGEFPSRGFGLAWHENGRTLYSPTEHGGEVRRSATRRENKKILKRKMRIGAYYVHAWWRGLSALLSIAGSCVEAYRSVRGCEATLLHGFPRPAGRGGPNPRYFPRGHALVRVSDAGDAD